MSLVQKKLADRSGASMVIALLLFLVCSVVSAMILVSIHQNSMRMPQMVEEQQQYQAVSSALCVLKEKVTADDMALSLAGSTTDINSFKYVLEQMAQEVKASGSAQPYTLRFSVDGEGAQALTPVRGELHMAGNYDLTIKVCNTQPEGANALALVCKAQVSGDTITYSEVRVQGAVMGGDGA